MYTDTSAKYSICSSVVECWVRDGCKGNRETSPALRELRSWVGWQGEGEVSMKVKHGLKTPTSFMSLKQATEPAPLDKCWLIQEPRPNGIWKELKLEYRLYFISCYSLQMHFIKKKHTTETSDDLRLSWYCDTFPLMKHSNLLFNWIHFDYWGLFLGLEPCC